MASPQIYDRFFVYINGKLLGEADSCSIEYQGSPVPVATFVKDFAGVTPVPKHAKVTVGSFVPQTGFEFPDPGPQLHVTGGDLLSHHRPRFAFAARWASRAARAWSAASRR